VRVEIPGEWLEKASYFRSSARRRVGEGAYWAACFEAQQSVEVVLKGLQIALLGVHEFIHDLARLLKGLEAVGVGVPGGSTSTRMP